MEAGDEHASQVRAKAIELLSQLPGDGYGKNWPSKEVRSAAFALHNAETGRKLSLSGCGACDEAVIDWLRAFKDLPKLSRTATKSLANRRLAVCRGTKGDGSDACEHLAWPGLNCAKCLCFVDIKARLKKQTCPEGKWQ